MTNDDAKIILKWRLESYSPISEYTVNNVCLKRTENIYRFLKFNETDARVQSFYLQLQYHRKNEEKWITVYPEVKNGKGNLFTVEHSIEELQPGSYEAILKAKNKFGWSIPSEPHTFTGGTYITLYKIFIFKFKKSLK